MNQKQLEAIRQAAPLAFSQIKKEHNCDDAEAAQILFDTAEVNMFQSHLTTDEHIREQLGWKMVEAARNTC